MKYSSLQRKFVVNEASGEMIGFVTDLDLRVESLCIESLIVQQSKTLLQRIRCLFVHDIKVVISIDQIVNIGKDVILVRIR